MGTEIDIPTFLAIIGAAFTVGGAAGGIIVWGVLGKIWAAIDETRDIQGILLRREASKDKAFAKTLHQHNRRIYLKYIKNGKRPNNGNGA